MSGIGILGGSFNPVHLAHLVVAERVREELALERVLLVPAARQPLKAHATLAPGADRLAMLELAAAENSALRADPVELERGGMSYTADTLADLARRAGGATLHLILGSDAYRSMGSWRRPEEIRRLARIVVVPRAGDRRPSRGLGAHGEESAAGDLFVDVPVLDISASDIRTRVARGASIRYLVPDAVRAYIESRGLYRGGEGRSGLTPAGSGSADEPIS